MNVSTILQNYNLKNLHIGVLGGHSALDVCHGAKKYGFRTVAVCQKGREKTYTKYYKTREAIPPYEGGDPPYIPPSEGGKQGGKGCIDETIIVEKFGDIVKTEVQEQLRNLNTIFVHSRYFWVYCDFNQIENDFQIPIYGSRKLLKKEERNQPKNQYHLLEKAGIRIPKIFPKPKDIDRLAIVKVNEALRGYERSFFFASSSADYYKKSQELIQNGTILKETLGEAVIIEEYIVGAPINLNFFYSPLSQELELMGADMRRQTNLDGLLRLPANEQLEALRHIKPKFIETGHVAVTMKESLLEKAFEIGEKFVTITQQEYPPGIIGPYALQGAVVAEEGKEEFVIFDVSLRIPGSPGTRFTPYSGYLYGAPISYGERIALEIKEAQATKQLEKILT